MKETLRLGGKGARVVVIAATALEYDALRRELRNVRIVKTGVALRELREPLGDTVISCGLAGGLRPGLPTGALLIPRIVRRPNGEMVACYEELVRAMTEGARSLGSEACPDPLLTAAEIVNNQARIAWSQQGFAGVDMETGLLQASRIVAVRVVLDTPEHELSSEWSNPLRALMNPRNWREIPWLAREAPRAAQLAARVVAQGIAGRLRITAE